MSKNINPFDIDTYEPGSMNNNETNQNQVTSPTTTVRIDLREPPSCTGNAQKQGVTKKVL